LGNYLIILPPIKYLKMNSDFKAGCAKYVGYGKDDYATPYSKFYDENIIPVEPTVTEALSFSPYPSGQLPAINMVTSMLNTGYDATETGYTFEPDGSARIAALIKMPGVTPAMWQWWFGWHGSHSNRYKLWHPKAHVSARWKDGNKTDLTYVGRTSMIEEYIGGQLEKVSIQFVASEKLGIASRAPEKETQECFICARIGFTGFPLDFGWLVHQVRATENGSEMRSRFWIGGEHIQLRMKGRIPALLSQLLQGTRTVQREQANNLLVHCVEEMTHLAAILPQLYSEFHLNDDRKTGL
jgi:hypothetical protein